MRESARERARERARKRERERESERETDRKREMTRTSTYPHDIHYMAGDLNNYRSVLQAPFIYSVPVTDNTVYLTNSGYRFQKH